MREDIHRGKDRQVMGKVTKVWVTGVEIQEDKKQGKGEETG